MFETRGNRYVHLVLRGGRQLNYDRGSVALSEKSLEKAGLRKEILVDCSHGNSNKDPLRQPVVFEDLIGQVSGGNRSIFGMMIESHLFAGNQSIPKDLRQLKYGISITDACLDWKTTEKMILTAAQKS